MVEYVVLGCSREIVSRHAPRVQRGKFKSLRSIFFPIVRERCTFWALRGTLPWFPQREAGESETDSYLPGPQRSRIHLSVIVHAEIRARLLYGPVVCARVWVDSIFLRQALIAKK